MNLAWFFDVESVASRNLFARELRITNTPADVFGVVYDARDRIPLRKARPIPLP
jgi:hypothetical protein